MDFIVNAFETLWTIVQDHPVVVGVVYGVITAVGVGIAVINRKKGRVG